MQKHDNSTNRSYNHPPLFDLNTLDHEHEIQIEYGPLGPTRIRKVPYFHGCFQWLALMASLCLCGIALWSGGG